jgi:hypothetical protein
METEEIFAEEECELVVYPAGAQALHQTSGGNFHRVTCGDGRDALRLAINEKLGADPVIAKT